MDQRQLAALIREHGALRMGRAIDGLFPAALGEGWDLTNWAVASASGAMLFTAYADERPSTPRRAALLAERSALDARLRELRVARHHDAAARRQAEQAQYRHNAIGHELAGLPDPDPAYQPVAGILVLNAVDTPERRAEYEPMVAAESYPLTLLFQPQAPC